ncbi:hypothetical protein [Castellaniella defragrans]|uniref:hypothetical protein n=1 Tax=Castellaniella defragrans TaxID=75697 RepID=UPI00130E23C5|nr:hypothetical protein [Castellaniella defragrans]
MRQENDFAAREQQQPSQAAMPDDLVPDGILYLEVGRLTTVENDLADGGVPFDRLEHRALILDETVRMQVVRRKGPVIRPFGGHEIDQPPQRMEQGE